MTGMARALAGTAVAAILLVAAPLYAQSWRPEKPVELLVGSGAGGSNDTMGRHLQKIIQEQKLVPVPVSVLNKVGGNQTLKEISCAAGSSRSTWRTITTRPRRS